MIRHSISSERIRITFGETPLTVREVRNEETGASLLRGGTQAMLLRLPGRISDPVFLTEVASADWSADAAAWVLTDKDRAFHASISVRPTPEGLRFDAAVTGPRPVWLAEWKLDGVDVREFILPALGGQSLSSSMPPDTQLSFKYPFWWNAQFAIGAGNGGGLWLHARDVDPRFKLIRLKRTGGRFLVSYGFEAEGPLRSNTLGATWYVDGYRGTWRTPVERHRAWLESAFGLTPLQENRFWPAWANDITFVLEMWGIGKESPHPLHTFDDMARRLRAWARMYDPTRTMVYVPGFAEHGIDSRAPFYRPSEELGGADSFRRLVDLAHRLGYRVMPHTNALCMTFEHPLYEEFRQHQVVDVFGREQGWALDIDGDWLAEPYFAYINPGAEAWGELMEKVIGELIRQYGADAIFLDQTLLAFNVARGPDFVAGMRRHLERLQRAYPETLFAGEGLHEQVLGALPMAQIHGIDSITEVHGLEGRVRWRRAHPVSTHLFGKYTRLTAHLLTKHPSHPLFALQERAYASLGVLPALCLYNRSQALDGPDVRRMIRRAKELERSRR